MASKVTLLEKSEGEWSQQEVTAIVEKLMCEVESLPKMPKRIAIMNKPLRPGTFQSVLGHSNFTSHEVYYNDRWVQ